MRMRKLAQPYPLPRFKRVRVTLKPRVFHLYDASFRRAYLTHKRTKESPEARYHIGDLVWVKKRDRPWWPAMVSVHPQRNYYLKYISDTEIAYHVQLFGPETDHHWVVKTFCKTFKGFDKFEKSMHKDISTSPTIKRAAVWRSYAVASSSQGQQLNEAISEAEKALKLEPLERLRRLTYWYYSTRYEKFFM